MKRSSRQNSARNNFELRLTENGYPIAYGHDENGQAIIECCPLCGERHFHGEGSYYGHKVEHCVPDNQKKWQIIHPETIIYAGKGYYIYPENETKPA